MRLPSSLARVLLAAPFVLAACNAGTGGTVPPSGTDVTVAVVDIQGRSVNGQAAFQIADEDWEPIAPVAVGTYEFAVPDGESRYGFTVNCSSGLQASSTKALTFQLTVEESTEVRATCPLSFVGATTTIAGTFDATAVGADNVQIHTDLDSEFGASGVASGPYGPLATSAGSGRTVVAVANDASFDPVAVKVVRNLNLSSATDLDVTFAAGDAVGSTLTPDFSGTVPVGFDASVQVSLAAQNAQFVVLASENTAAPASVPTVSGLQANDLYLVISSASDPGSPATFATVQFQDALAGLDLDLPAPWTTTPSIVGSALPTFTGLTELPDAPDFRGHALILAWDGIANVPPPPGVGTGALWQGFVSTGWLGSETSYRMPDFTSLPGFAGAKPLSGEDAAWVIGAVASSLDTSALVTEEAFPFGYGTGIFGPIFPPRVEGAVSRIGLMQDSFVVP